MFIGSAPGDSLRLLITAGDPRGCRALVHLLQEVADITVGGTAGTAETLLARATALYPLVAILAARTAQLDGLAVLPMYPKVAAQLARRGLEWRGRCLTEQEVITALGDTPIAY